MKNKTSKFVLCALLPVVLSSCYTAKLNYKPDDTIFIFPESPLIQSGLSTKQMSFSFSYMKNKGERFKVIKKIESINQLALTRFKQQTINTQRYTSVTELSHIGLQLVSWIAILEASQGNMVQKQMSGTEALTSIKSLKTSNVDLQKLIDQTNFEGEDGILEFLKALAVALEQMLDAKP